MRRDVYKRQEYGYLKNVYWLYDCAAAFTQELNETVSYEYTDDTYHTVTAKGGTYCAFCYGTNHTTSSKLERHSMVTEVLPQPANGRFATVEKMCIRDRCSCGQSPSDRGSPGVRRRRRLPPWLRQRSFPSPTDLLRDSHRPH